ncbi:sterol desaturase family protein [Gramella sp. BOM4]|nr:sterol desaturase family protein [Christiangramia bathymodioli]
MMKTRIELNEVLENSPNIILYGAPILIGLALIEVILSMRHNKSKYEGKDFLSSLVIGLVHLVEGLFTKTGFFLLVIWLYNLVPWSIPVNIATSVLCFVVLDFCRYWSHRLSHEINFLWATHVTHHSSTQFNLSTAFRQSWTQGIKIIFYLPVSLLGFHPVIFYITHQLALLYSFAVHTKSIKNLPKWYSYIFVTPSHHKVHHAKNAKYLDKNYGSALIIWDRLFNTFQELDENEKPEYGILDQPKTFNPIYLVFHVWVDIFKKMKAVKTFRERWDIFFKSPGYVKNELYLRKQESKFSNQ